MLCSFFALVGLGGVLGCFRRSTDFHGFYWEGFGV